MAAKRKGRSPIPVYDGRFGRAQAERLLWRAGFGPKPGEARALARLGLTAAVRSLTRPGPEVLTGPEPTDAGAPLDPMLNDSHGHVWWLDRMIRSNRPLVERMTLIWHDWFATSNAGVGYMPLLLAQNELMRSHALGSFADLLTGVTSDGAMLVWLNGNLNTRVAPNENYAREMMELFTLGANRGYTEDDVREHARALTGWRTDFDNRGKPAAARFDLAMHDADMKTIFGQQGAFNWADAGRLCVEHPLHPSFFVSKLWSYFIPTPPPRRTRRALEALYRARKFQVRPVVEAILRHPALYEGPTMIKPPVVYTAGLLRTLGRGIDMWRWTWDGQLCGQQLFLPPNVAGWNDDLWLDLGTFLGRWIVVTDALDPYALTQPPAGSVRAADLVDRALAFWHHPRLSAATRKHLQRFAASTLKSARGHPELERVYPMHVENALRQLIAASPDMQVS